MWKITLCLLAAVIVLEFASCSITCPDGKVCSSSATCCRAKHGHECCPYPKAVCCSDLAHCCPSGFTCNVDKLLCEKQAQPWMNVPMAHAEAGEEQPSLVKSAPDLEELRSNRLPDLQRSTVIYCDPYTYCPDRTTCCRTPGGVWACCPFYPGQCCLDGYHCCPYGYNCDPTYKYCVRRGLPYPFVRKQLPSSVPAALISPPEGKSIQQEMPMTPLAEASGSTQEAGVIRCDAKFYCKQGASCCKGPEGQWSCCPYKGQCCADGLHCCEYGYTCEPTSLSCRKQFLQIPPETQEHVQTI